MPTPLAAKILKNLYLPVKKRRFIDQTGLLKELPGAQYFECTDILPLAFDAMVKFGNPKIIDIPVLQFTVLPAETTWLEFKVEDGSRRGVLLRSDHGDLMKGNLSLAESRGSVLKATFDYSASPPIFFDWPRGTYSEDQANHLALHAPFVPIFLSIIGTPKICKRIIRSASHGVPQRGRQGRWPSDDTWTEVKIYVDEGIHSDPTVVGPLTGRKALHHVRSFWRPRLGRWELVRAHWRGDGSLGIVRSRYKPTTRNAERATP